MTSALFWMCGAALVAIVHVTIDPLSPLAGAIASTGALLLAAGAYMRLPLREPTIDRALGVGVAWFALAIVTDMVTTRLFGFDLGLLGAPAQPLLRTLNLFSWIFSPALFARQR